MKYWELEIETFLERVNLNRHQFFEQASPPPASFSHLKIVPLSHVTNVQLIVPLRLDFLTKLLRNVQTTGEHLHPYRQANIRLAKIDPNLLTIGQRYLYEEKCSRALHRTFAELQKFTTGSSGLSDFGAYFVFGTSVNASTPCMAIYLPPIIEIHNSNLILLDGIHRHYIAKQAGCTAISVIVDHVSVPFPCQTKPWSEIRLLSEKEKPTEIKDRYFGLYADHFRDLKYIGIDG